MNLSISEEQLNALNQVLSQYSELAKIAFAQHDYAQAYQLVSEVLKIVPEHPIALSDLAIAELRLGHFEIAYQHFLQALEFSGDSVSINLYDGLTEACYFLNKPRDQKKIWTFSCTCTKKAS